MTATSLAMTGKIDEARLLLIAIANGVDRKLHANLTSFVSILSVTSGDMLPPPHLASTFLRVFRNFTDQKFSQFLPFMLQ